MLARFLKEGDARLEQVNDFEIQTIHDNGEIQDIDWNINTTFNAVFGTLEKKHRKGIEVSVLDYGESLQATVTANATSIKHYYVVMMA